MTYNSKEEEKSWLEFRAFVLGLFMSSVLCFLAGVFVHSCYNKEIKKSVWIQAVERGYAKELETSEGKVFMWKENDDYVDTWTIGMKNES